VDETYARIRGHWHYIYRAIDGHGQIVDAYVSPTRDIVAARSFFERAIASSGTTPRRVITDKAATYPPALAAAVPGVLHRTGRYRTNGVERDHGFLKERLQPMRGLKSLCFSGDLHAWSRRGAQHPPWVLPDRGVRPAAAGLRVGLEPTRRSGVIRQKTVGDQRDTLASGCCRSKTPRRCKRTTCEPVNEQAATSLPSKKNVPTPGSTPMTFLPVCPRQAPSGSSEDRRR
jgi:hypothetical protein